MVTIKEDFIEKFNKKLWVELQCVMHSREEPPEDETGKVIFRMLEMIDWECPKYGDSHGMTYDQIKSFLVCHKEEIKKMKINPPSYLGLLGGTFDFLTEEES